METVNQKVQSVSWKITKDLAQVAEHYEKNQYSPDIVKAVIPRDNIPLRVYGNR